MTGTHCRYRSVFSAYMRPADKVVDEMQVKMMKCIIMRVRCERCLHDVKVCEEECPVAGVEGEEDGRLRK